MGCLSFRQKLDRYRRECRREARRCDIQYNEARREQMRLDMELKSEHKRKSSHSLLMGIAKSIVKSVAMQVTMLRIKDDLKDIEIALQDAGSQVAMEDIYKRFTKTLESANSSITTEDMAKIAASLSVNSQKLKQKLAMSRQAMDDVRDGIDDANEEAGLVDEETEDLTVVDIAQRLIEELTDDDLEQAPRVVQKSRAPPREEKLVPLDPKT
jgi:hypothetical protein